MRLFALLSWWMALSASAGALVSVSDLQRGMVAGWRFAEQTGTLAGDVSGNANTGTLSGSTLPVWTNGVASGGLEFNGTTAYVDDGNGTSLNLASSITVSAWVKAVTYNGVVLIAKRDNVDYSWEIALTSGGASFRVNANGNNAASSSTYSTAVWTHIVGVYDGAHISIYSDGVLDCTPSAYSTAITTSTVHVSLGRRNYPTAEAYYSGLASNVRIYNRALSAVEILNLYSAGAGHTP